MKIINLLISDKMLEKHKNNHDLPITLNNFDYWKERVNGAVCVKLNSKNKNSLEFLIKKIKHEKLGDKKIIKIYPERRVDEALNNKQMVIATHMTLFINDIVYGLIVDIDDMIKSSGVYRFGVKKILNQLLIEKSKFESKTNMLMGSGSWDFADMNEIFQNEISHDLNILKLQIKQVLDKHNVSNSNIIALLETARTIAGFADAKHEQNVNVLTKRFGDIVQRLKHLSIHPIFVYIGKLLHEFSKQITQHVDLNTPEVQMSFRILATKLADVKITVKAINRRQAV